MYLWNHQFSKKWTEKFLPYVLMKTLRGDILQIFWFIFWKLMISQIHSDLIWPLALTKNEVTKICNEPGINDRLRQFDKFFNHFPSFLFHSYVILIIFFLLNQGHRKRLKNSERWRKQHPEMEVRWRFGTKWGRSSQNSFGAKSSTHFHFQVLFSSPLRIFADFASFLFHTSFWHFFFLLN